MGLRALGRESFRGLEHLHKDVGVQQQLHGSPPPIRSSSCSGSLKSSRMRILPRQTPSSRYWPGGLTTTNMTEVLPSVSIKTSSLCRAASISSAKWPSASAKVTCLVLMAAILARARARYHA